MFHKKDQSIGNNLHWRAGEARDYRIVDGLGCPPENDLLDFNLSETLVIHFMPISHGTSKSWQRSDTFLSS